MTRLVTFKALRRVALVALLIPIASMVLAAQTADSAAITKQLDEARSHSALARDDAALLDSYIRSRVSWQTHAARLQSMKEHVNNLINDYKQLGAMREEGSEWQKEGIDRIDPLLRSMADHLGATIKHLNDNQNRINLPEYRDYVRANYELIDKTHNLIRDFVDYGDARMKADNLEQKLELPAQEVAEQ